ncbi:TRAP transporter large permease [Halopseudomonas laoshanensis]|jgi:C4-dicarboxylate transporter DctM subunit|uniref:TRAP transporter large permease protein n=2 Tax=Halopseudomonas TaxID=2901189 RepID=A0A7V7GVM1_9GAMM|nr:MULTISPECIES: TRAP transporter large permease [Halopseudomonas]MBQ0743652.1 TRAP transporter large permease [Pseudomonas sp.]KAA0696243.1 TRAP transporter large permease [Halopseudomonas laoshanensis]MBQ0777412.1 TRAP transporter large permease [Pseudomonas sp.]PCC98381.1 C4-dicarboxylate ABC transporter permease [Halopseudomonas pelagia]QFY56606.1 TRAP transporter large permease [Halopseudomonas pelagia]
MLTIIIISMIVLLLLGFPMMVPLLVASLMFMFLVIDMNNVGLLMGQMISGVQSWALAAVPLFIFAADLMTRGHTANRLLDLVQTFVGHLRGGLPITTAAGCTLFGAVSGSTQATVVAMGGPMRPKLLEKGYSDSFSIALIINSSDIALLIPPSIGMIIYGVVSGASIGDLFIAGILPGLLILLMFSVYCWYASLRMGIAPEEKATWVRRGQALKKALLPLGFPLVVVGGIYGGIFSPTEAAAIAVLYALVLEVVILRAVKVTELWDIALSTGLITAVVFILVAAGNAFTYTISFAGIPQAILGPVIETIGDSQLLVLGLIAVSFFVGCMFVDPIVVILILTPLFKPAVAAAGLDPVHVGVIVTLQAAIGSATPPFGCDIFTAMAVFRRPYFDVIRGTLPFILILLLATALLIMFPAISLWLPSLGGG